MKDGKIHVVMQDRETGMATVTMPVTFLNCLRRSVRAFGVEASATGDINPVYLEQFLWAMNHLSRAEVIFILSLMKDSGKFVNDEIRGAFVRQLDKAASALRYGQELGVYE